MDPLDTDRDVTCIMVMDICTVLCVMCMVRQVRDSPRYNPAQISGWAVVM